jgi:fructosamine-3-kinase
LRGNDTIHQIAAEVAQNESLSDYELHLLMTPFAGYDMVATKTLISLDSNGRRERIFVKISNSEKLSHFLQNEAESLNACKSLGIECIPRVLACGSIEGRYFLAQSFVPGRTMHSRQSYLNSALAKTKGWLAALYEKTRGPPVEPTELVRRASEYAKFALGVFDLDDCLALMEKLSPQSPIPTFRIHGDFWHGNILLQGEAGICVTDFAFSALGEPPIDSLDLICDYDASIFLEPGRLRTYSQYFPFSADSIQFLHLYALIRKIGLKVDRRRKLYEELLINDFEGSLNEISEVGVAKRFVRRVVAKQA